MIDTRPMYFCSKEYSELFSLDKSITTASCLKLGWLLDTSGRKILTSSTKEIAVDDNIHKCVINTKDIDTRMFLLSSIIPDYVHPNFKDLIKILSFSFNKKTEIHDIKNHHIKNQISIIEEQMDIIFYYNFSDYFIDEGLTMSLFKIYKKKGKWKYDRISLTEIGNMDLVKIFLVHQSLIDYINRV